MDTDPIAQIVIYATGVGIAGLIALVLRLDRRSAYQNGTMERVVKDLDEHRRNDREDFHLVHQRLDEVLERSVVE